jgi:predicted thioesterase
MALNGSKPLSEPGEGTRVDIRHLAPTPEGGASSAKRRMTRVDGRRVEFIVGATDIEEIGAESA